MCRWVRGQWARVNSYMTGKGGARTADAKIYSKYQKKDNGSFNQKQKETFESSFSASH